MTATTSNAHSPARTEPLVWQSGTAQVGEIELAWEEAGVPTGEPLLLVAGLTMQLVHWPEAFVEPLTRAGFRVIRYDHRDIGLSASSNRGVPFDLRRDMMLSRVGARLRANYTLYDLADDAVGLMDSLEISRAHLVGVSMGGMIGQIIAAKYPGRVRSLTSIMSSTNEPWLPPPTIPVIRQMFFRRPRNREREQVVRHAVTMMRLLASPGFPTSDAEFKKIAETAYDRADRPGGVLRQTHAVLATGGFAHLLPAITAPTQIVHGLADPLVRSIGGKRSAKLIRTSRLDLVPGMGHDLPKALSPRLSNAVLSNVARC